MIDYAIRAREKEEKKQILKNALIQFKKPANQLMRILVQIYKASCDAAPLDLKDNYKDLFSTDHFYLSIRFLDFKKKAPVIPYMDWAHYATYEVNLFKESLDKVLDGVMNLNADMSMKFQRESLCLLAHEQIAKDLKIFLNRLFALVDYLENQVNEHNGLHYDNGIWLNNIAPKIASARI